MAGQKIHAPATSAVLSATPVSKNVSHCFAHTGFSLLISAIAMRRI